ncbi:hypothetical protein M378DRAFT_397480 [Amanita muscaria Koide BX008]|uniref:Uncharacterized protein n=1 Tax=Amanita muscaria (strain Koide BX008) TaxID=946122 RepID=A0A0C2W7Y1_AMAMK|nr:hypothetical protein M378DRAFT_397480 [Amanita muscaria Koide BX008]
MSFQSCLHWCCIGTSVICHSIIYCTILTPTRQIPRSPIQKKRRANQDLRCITRVVPTAFDRFFARPKLLGQNCGRGPRTHIRPSHICPRTLFLLFGFQPIPAVRIKTERGLVGTRAGGCTILTVFTYAPLAISLSNRSSTEPNESSLFSIYTRSTG